MDLDMYYNGPPKKKDNNFVIGSNVASSTFLTILDLTSSMSHTWDWHRDFGLTFFGLSTLKTFNFDTLPQITTPCKTFKSFKSSIARMDIN